MSSTWLMAASLLLVLCPDFVTLVMSRYGTPMYSSISGSSSSLFILILVGVAAVGEQLQRKYSFTSHKVCLTALTLLL